MVAHWPQPTQRLLFTSHVVSTVNALNGQCAAHSPQPMQVSPSTAAQKSELTLEAGTSNSATLRSIPQQQVQQLQIYEFPSR